MRNNLSDKLTILVLTYNRYPRLIRLLRYIDAIHSPYKINVLDSSREFYDLSPLASLLERNNITHHRFDPALRPLEKIHEAMKEVTTPYVVLWADDDLMVLPSLKDGVEFLEKNTDFNLVQGPSCLFALDHTSSENKVSAVSPYPQGLISDQTAAGRLVNHLGHYTTTCYSIHRTQNYKRIMELCFGLKVSYGFGELLPSSLAVIQGKAGQIKRLYMVRECHNQMDSWNNSGRPIDVFDIITALDFGQNYEKFKNCLAGEIVRHDGIAVSQAEDFVKQAFWSYLNRSLRIKFEQQYKRGLLGMRLRAKQSLKGNRLARKSLLPPLRFLRSKIYLRETMSLSALLNSKSPYHEDFMPIYRAVTAPLEMEAIS